MRLVELSTVDLRLELVAVKEIELEELKNLHAAIRQGDPEVRRGQLTS